MKNKYIRRIFLSQFLILDKIKSILTKKEIERGYIFLFLMFISMFFETLGIGLIAPLVTAISDPNILISNNYLSGVIEFLKISDFKSLILIFSISLVVIYLVKNLFLSYFTWFKIHYLSTLRMNLSNRLFKIYLSQPYTFHLQHNSGQLIQNTISEVTVFTGRLLGPMLVILTEGLVFLGIVILLFYIEPIGAISVTILLGLVTKLILSLTRKNISRWGKERQYHDGKKIQHLQQGLGGVKDALILGKEEHFLKQFQHHNLLGRRPDQKQAFLQEVPRFLFEFLAVIGLIIIILSMTLQGKQISLILATLGIFGAAAFRLMPSITRILAAIQSVRYGFPVLEKLHQEFDNIDSGFNINEYKESLNSFSEPSNSLVFNNVSYSYPNTTKASLKNASLKIYQGESIGIIGPSGAGKSTLVDILLGLLKPEFGKVNIDDQDIHNNLRSWQDQIGYVPQFIYLTDDSLRNNIAFGVVRKDIDDSLIDRVISSAQLTDFVGGLPEGLDTHVGERGVRLSGGQRQRIGIARALYHNPNIIVLDEATSSLDNITEKRIMETVFLLKQHKTVIIIAHRMSTLESCNRIYRLENGEIVEMGSPEKLLKNG